MKNIFLLAAAGGAGFLYYLTKQVELEFTHTKIPAAIFVYKEHLGSYMLLDPTFNSIKDDFEYLNSQRYTLAGLFYDHPSQVKDHKHERSVFGAFVDPADAKAVKEFLKVHTDYKSINTDEVDAISVTYPYSGYSTFAQLGFKVYHKLYEYAFKDREFQNSDFVCLMHKYHYLHGDNKTIEVLLPYGKYAKEFMLTTAPEPLKSQMKGYSTEVTYLNALYCAAE